MKDDEMMENYDEMDGDVNIEVMLALLNDKIDALSNLLIKKKLITKDDLEREFDRLQEDIEDESKSFSK